MNDEPTPYEKFRALAKRVLSVPRSEIERLEAAYKKSGPSGNEDPDTLIIGFCLERTVLTRSVL